MRGRDSERVGAPAVTAEFTPVEVLPQAGAMVVLDRILDCRDDRVVAGAAVKPSSLFLNAEGVVPPWIGLEYMAQAVAAWAGIEAKQGGRAVEVGYLIATRSYEATGQGFALGDRLEVTAKRIRHEGPLAVFECTIESEHCDVRATVTVYRSQAIPGDGEIGE